MALNKRTALALFLVATAIGLLNFSVVWTSELAERAEAEAKYPFLYEMTGAYAVLILLPLLFAFIRRYRMNRSNWPARLPLHLAMTIAFGITHTLLMWGSRSLLFEILGWGRYDYGDMRFRFVMEYQKQFIIYWLVYATIELVDWFRRNAGLQRQLADARLEALKMQLNPHFLFNTLNMISSHVHENPDVADEMITHLSDFLRLTLQTGDVREVPLKRELEFLDAYLAIMKARFQEKLEIELAVDDETEQALVPPLILQPLVENSIAHSIDRGSGAGWIRVSAKRSNGSLRLEIEDNGGGVAEDAVKRQGIGLSNTSERLERLYPSAHRLELTNRPEGGSKLTMWVPWRVA
ncbi:MAG TPA: histidine kinase [Thermoanaerobaculia bacterium]